MKVVLIAMVTLAAHLAAAEPLTVMTFNIRYGTANDGPNRWELRRGQLLDLLRTQNPDVIGLQEALHFQIDEILAALPDYRMVGVGRSDGGQGGEYAAILYRASRLSVRRSQTFWLSDTPEIVKSNTWGAALERICTWALFDDRAGTPFYVFNLHLDHVSQPAREKSVTLLLERVAARLPVLPVVITGDFNVGESNPAARAMRRAFRDTFRVIHPDRADVGTANAFTVGSIGAEKIDYVFVEPGTEVLGADIIRTSAGGRYPSDHFPVVARIRFPTPAARPEAARPNLEGTWNSATATPLERPPHLKDTPFFTPAEAAEWERQYAERNAEPAPAALATSKGTGTYNTFFREFGTRVVTTLRTSIVTEPADGRIPPLTPAAEAARRQRVERIAKMENPEDLGLQDQCLTFLSSGPPLLPYTYNSNYQIAQTDRVIVVHAEMLSEARLIYLDGRPHPPPQVQLWTGHSVGRWEGDTLVVETTNFADGRGFYGDAGGNFAWDRHLRLIERFSLLDRDTLLYRFEIDNPTAYTRPWKGELTMTRTDQRIYEFACHEANYSLENMLRGQRATERKAGGGVKPRP